MTFSELSKLLRKEKGISQVQLAEALNVSKACISMIEIGKNEPTANTLIRYADFFGCSTDFLLGRSDELGVISIQSERANTLSAEERQLVEAYRKLPKDLKKRTTSYINKLLALMNEEKQLFKERM